MIRAEHVAYKGKRRGAYRVLVGKPEGKKPHRRPRSIWEDNIKMNHQEVGWGMVWIDLAQNRDGFLALLYALMNLWVPYNAANCLTS